MVSGPWLGQFLAGRPSPSRTLLRPRLRARLRARLWLLLLAAALGASQLARPPAGVSAAAGPAATVQEILDGRQLYIEQRQAKVRDGALVPERLRTGNSRAQVAFRTGGSARINRFSQMKLGTSCFFLSQGQVLVSGPQNGCTRSSRLSVRGTNYLLSVSATGQSELTVLEGQVLVEAERQGNNPPLERPTAVFGGHRVSLKPDGTISDRSRLSQAEMAAILNGPLFQGFLVPLSHQQALQTFLQQAYPNLNSAPAADATALALQATINQLRREQVYRP